MEKGKFTISGAGIISVDAIGTVYLNDKSLSSIIMNYFDFDSLEAGEIEKVFPGRVFLMISKEPLLVENTMVGDHHE